MVTIGRSLDADLSVDHRSLSRMHARVERDGGSLRIRDLGSQNGTFLNGSPVEDAAPFRPGDEVELGSHVLTLIEEPRDARPAPATPVQSNGKVAVLTVTAEGVAAASFAVLSPEIVLGRSENVDVTLPSKKISRRHARLRRAGAFFVLSDEGSQNGTFFQQKRITKPTSLKPGDTFHIEPFTLHIDERAMDLPAEAAAPEAQDEPMPTAMFLRPEELKEAGPAGAPTDGPEGAFAAPTRPPGAPSSRKAELAAWQDEFRARFVAEPAAQADTRPNPKRPSRPAEAALADGWADEETGVEAEALGSSRPSFGNVVITLLRGQVLEVPLRQPMMTLGDTPDCDIALAPGDYPIGPVAVLVAAEGGRLAVVHLGRGQPPVVRGLESERALLDVGEVAVLGPIEVRWDG